MSPVKLSAIEGLVPEKYTPNTTGLWRERYDGWNAAIDLQGSKSIGLNRERLAEAMFNTEHPGDSFGNPTPIPWNKINDRGKNPYYILADAIIAQEETLLECKPDAL